MTSRETPDTAFTRDALGRYVCNGLDEALQSTDAAIRPDARPFDVVVLGDGSFGPVFAQHLLAADVTRSRRILLLDAGPFLIPGHVQNLPLSGLDTPGPVTADPPDTTRAEVWQLPWRTDDPKGFPGLAFCLGGRSVYFGGWSPRLLPSEMPPSRWPAQVTSDLNGPLVTGAAGYFDQASRQIGTSSSTDFIDGPMHEALRAQLKGALDAGRITGAIALGQLPLHVDDAPPGMADAFKLEAPLAILNGSPRSGVFSVGKFSSVPLLMQATRAAQAEHGDDVKRRLMVVPRCRVLRLVTDGDSLPRRVVAVQTTLGTVPVPAEGIVVLALGTIESARLALDSLPGVPAVGANLMAHLRSNLTIRIPRASLAGLDPAVNELQASALFVKGRHAHADGLFGHFHLQITASGLRRPTTSSEAELFKAIPDLDTLEALRRVTDDHVVLTIRGIGEMRPGNPASRVTLASETDERGMRRAHVTLKPSLADSELWSAMDRASDDAALAFAGGGAYEVLVGGAGGAFQAVAAGQPASGVLPFAPRHDGMGTTHHEAGTLAMGSDPGSSVVDGQMRLHQVTNAYVAGPAAFPTVGSPNPMLTGVALARRLADHVASARPAFMPDAGFTSLFDGTALTGWRMSTIRNQPGRESPGTSLLTDGSIELVSGSDLGLLWHERPAPPDFVLRLEYRCFRPDDNTGVFVRFPHPDAKGYDNTAYVGVDFGFEVQVDDLARPSGLALHRTGAVYGFSPSLPGGPPVRPLGQWNALEVRVQGNRYVATVNGVVTTDFTFVPGSDPAHPDRGLPPTAAAPRFLGLQAHTGRVGFRKIQIRALERTDASCAGGRLLANGRAAGLRPLGLNPSLRASTGSAPPAGRESAPPPHLAMALRFAQYARIFAAWAAREAALLGFRLPWSVAARFTLAVGFSPRPACIFRMRSARCLGV